MHKNKKNEKRKAYEQSNRTASKPNLNNSFCLLKKNMNIELKMNEELEERQKRKFTIHNSHTYIHTHVFSTHNMKIVFYSLKKHTHIYTHIKH